MKQGVVAPRIIAEDTPAFSAHASRWARACHRDAADEQRNNLQGRATDFIRREACHARAVVRGDVVRRQPSCSACCRRCARSVSIPLEYSRAAVEQTALAQQLTRVTPQGEGAKKIECHGWTIRTGKKL